jgi:hypothetical protein
MRRKFKDDFYKCIALIAFLFVLAVSNIFAQTASRLFGNCPNTTIKAEIKVEKGNLVLKPCPTKTLLYNGSPFSISGLASLNGIVAATQTFATPTAADTVSWLSAGSEHTLRLPITAVSGTSRTNFLPYFTGQNTLGKSLISQTGSAVSIETDGAIAIGSTAGGILRFNTGVNGTGSIDAETFQFTSQSNSGNVSFESNVNFLNKIKVGATCSGQSTIVSNTVTVPTSCMTGTSSKVFITPTTGGELPYISAKANGSFTATCSDGTCSNVTFDWFIINVT